MLSIRPLPSISTRRLIGLITSTIISHEVSKYGDIDLLLLGDSVTGFLHFGSHLFVTKLYKYSGLFAAFCFVTISQPALTAFRSTEGH